MYNIEFETSFEESWRFNIVLMCGGYKASAEQLYVVSTEDNVADMEDKLTAQPKGYKLPRKLSLQADKANNIRALIYIIPHTAPANRDIADFAPFEAKIKISRGSKVVYSKVHEVNQWSGDSIEIKL